MADLNLTTSSLAPQHPNGHRESVFSDTDLSDLQLALLLQDKGTEEAVIGSLLLDGESFEQVNRTAYPYQLLLHASTVLLERDQGSLG